MPTCSVYGCKNTTGRNRICKEEEIHFHRFPNRSKSPCRFSSWVLFCKRKYFSPGRGATVCSVHFKNTDYDETQLLKMKLMPKEKLQGPKLKPGAVPSIRCSAPTDGDNSHAGMLFHMVPASQNPLGQYLSSSKMSRRKSVSEIMEEADFIKCEPKWLCDAEESPNLELDCHPPCDDSVEIKVEPYHLSDVASDAEDISKSIKQELSPQVVKEDPSEHHFSSEILPNEIQSSSYRAIAEDNEATRECSKKSKELDLLSGAVVNGIYACRFCSKTFKENKGLQSHLRVHKSEDRNLCAKCGKTFRRKSHLKAHAKLHTGENLHYCRMCGKEFVSKKAMTCHLIAHSGERKFICNICGKSYSHSSSLSLHHLSHSGVVCECGLCGRVLSSKRNLDGHMPSHSNEKPYNCASCGKAFLSKNSLRKHMFKHTDDVPHNCATCNKSYSSRTTLQDHIKVNHTTKSNSICNYCHKTFTSRTGLAKHLRKHTKLVL